MDVVLPKIILCVLAVVAGPNRIPQHAMVVGAAEDPGQCKTMVVSSLVELDKTPQGHAEIIKYFKDGSLALYAIDASTKPLLQLEPGDFSIGPKNLNPAE